MKITELAEAMTGMPMGEDPVKAIDDAIKQKTEQLQALQKELADLKTQKPKVQAAAQQQKAAAQQQQQTQQQTNTAPNQTMNTNVSIQPTAAMPT